MLTLVYDKDASYSHSWFFLFCFFVKKGVAASLKGLCDCIVNRCLYNFVPGESTMSDLSEFQRGQIVGARLVGASVTTVAQVLGVSRGTVSKVMTAYNMH
ncbi:helix-turn-helix domain-containing protein [Salmonella enterica subsp. enterica serovar Derby]|nr:helix-turn-helix domain-containing protein [Salmonella enterica subsp. enterica serovar Derby]